MQNEPTKKEQCIAAVKAAIESNNIDEMKKVAVEYNGMREMFALEGPMTDIMGDAYWDWADEVDLV